jgi:hypothetical protein
VASESEGERGGPGAGRAALLTRYRELVLAELPRRAREQGWPVTEDHCFGRIVLDGAVGGRWYDVLDRRRSPAFAQLDDARLAAAVALAERIAAEGDPLLRELDARSLAWRGKPAKRRVREGRAGAGR